MTGEIVDPKTRLTGEYSGYDPNGIPVEKVLKMEQKEPSGRAGDIIESEEPLRSDDDHPSSAQEY